MCSGNELFFAMLYILHFTEGPLCEFLFYVFIPEKINFYEVYSNYIFA